jgi:hypothetical protein
MLVARQDVPNGGSVRACRQPAPITVRRRPLRLACERIAEYGVTVGGVHALAGDTQIIRLWRRIQRLRRPSLMPRADLPLRSILLQCYHRPGFFLCD